MELPALFGLGAPPRRRGERERRLRPQRPHRNTPRRWEDQGTKHPGYGHCGAPPPTRGCSGHRGDQPQLVFNRIGPHNPNTVIAQLAEQTQRHWQGHDYDGDFHTYDGKLLIVVTGMKQLKEHGLAGVVFRRFGRPHNQPLIDAIGNPPRSPRRPQAGRVRRPPAGAPGGAAPHRRTAQGREGGAL
ncbi:hypothetical protein [Streptomyces rubrogriseus]|uniref:Uncharacterized protein n=1 Tax=Streptomyces rubrogriseus TaxID=194673 RepID=A0A6G3T5B1_9ACTN|nr:hypothetical protein [Streptomyces rubrogriseus]NEC31907.1 hypothetical protein [Streptomyces rubrogriseus]